MPTVLPYHEPTLINLLIFSSFIYLLNIIRVGADFLVHGGIVAEIALGIVFGSPLTGLLHIDWEATFTIFGYIGLVLVVFEGGLSSNLRMLFRNLPLSLVCAITGIILPIALSFASLYAGFGYRPLEAFAAGAALSSDSLGTTLAALNSAAKSSATAIERTNSVMSDPQAVAESLPIARTLSPTHRADTSATLTALSPSPTSLKQSRIGTVLISAAIIDDVLGLIVAAVMPALALVQSPTSNLGGDSIIWPVVRPLLSSILMACISPIVCRFVLRPLFWYHGVGERWCAPSRSDKPWSFTRLSERGWGSITHADSVKLFLMVAMLSAMSTIAHYTGTSVLFGAYITGLMLTYIAQPPAPSQCADTDVTSYAYSEEKRSVERREIDLSFEATFVRLVGPLQEYVLLPLFFASIGFAIPFLDLWRPVMIWRGIVYSILMCLAKLAVGVPILLYGPYLHYSPLFWAAFRRRASSSLSNVRATLPFSSHRADRTAPRDEERFPRSSTLTVRDPGIQEKNHAIDADATSLGSNDPIRVPSTHRAATSIPAAAFMGAAMVARGEIGLLIAQLARGGSEHAPGGSGVEGVLSEEPFLLCIWAILLCTLVGPVALGYFVRRWGPRLNSGIWA
ncbi:hypothetical protein BC628DRAFT_1408747 [Trametes gibbosa]|nr:hypothetical protein BC628DRAFT_1408747 [Trametes gibbosa]